jgi:hypothetical protein
LTDYGVTPTGFVKKDLDTIKEEIEQDIKDQTGKPNLNFLAAGRFGQIIGVFADKLREMWDVDQAVYGSQYPDSASDASLDNVASITNAIRLSATTSDVVLDQLWLKPGGTIDAGSTVSAGQGGNTFRLLESVTNSGTEIAPMTANAEAVETGPLTAYAYSIDTIVTGANSDWLDTPTMVNQVTGDYTFTGAQILLAVSLDGQYEQFNTWQEYIFTAGTYTTNQVVDLLNNNLEGVTFAYELNKIRVTRDEGGEGSSIRFIEFNPITNANQVLQFPEFIQGFNTTDAIPGTNTEEDPAFRLRRIELLSQGGRATVEAIRSNLRALTDVLQVQVIENTTLLTDINGLPGKSFEAIIQGGDHQTIIDEIWRVKGGGIQAFGSISGIAVDSMGKNQTMYYSRPTEVPIYMSMTLTIDSDSYPVDGDSQVKDALKAAGDALEVGENVIALAMKCVPLEIPGVVDVPVFKIDIVDPPTGTDNILIDVRGLATVAIANIDVVTTV